MGNLLLHSYENRNCKLVIEIEKHFANCIANVAFAAALWHSHFYVNCTIKLAIDAEDIWPKQNAEKCHFENYKIKYILL